MFGLAFFRALLLLCRVERDRDREGDITCTVGRFQPGLISGKKLTGVEILGAQIAI